MTHRRVLGVVLTTLFAAGAAHGAPARQAQESLVELVPARARVSAILRKNAIAPLRALLGNNPEMQRELSAYLERSFGIDVTRIEGVAVFSSDPAHFDQHVGVVVRIPSSTGGALKLPAAGDAGGTPMYRVDRSIVCARTKAGLALGTEAEVRSIVAVERGREQALPRDAGLGKLLAASSNDIDFVLAVGPGALPPDKAMGVETGIFTYHRSGALDLVLNGDPNQLAALRGMASGGIQMGLAALLQEKEKAVATNDPVKGAAAIVTYHQARQLAAEVEPKLEGSSLRSHYQLPEGGQLGGSSLIAAFIGVGAAVAVPAFNKYVRRSKTSEARMNVRAIVNGLVALAEGDAKKLAQLRATEWTPPKGCCGQPDDQCAASAGAWQGATWKAIGFSVDGRSRYQYRVRIEGKAPKAKYVVEARGDLDCNGVFSTYRRSASFGPNGPELSPDVEVENENE